MIRQAIAENMMPAAEEVPEAGEINEATLKEAIREAILEGLKGKKKPAVKKDSKGKESDKKDEKPVAKKPVAKK